MKISFKINLFLHVSSACSLFCYVSMFQFPAPAWLLPLAPPTSHSQSYRKVILVIKTSHRAGLILQLKEGGMKLEYEISAFANRQGPSGNAVISQNTCIVYHSKGHRPLATETSRTIFQESSPASRQFSVLAVLTGLYFQVCQLRLLHLHHLQVLHRSGSLE